jgi:uncharacterized protein DUF6328
MFQERVSATERCSEMDAAEKIKIALDETRMLVLGAQVLLGFQMRSVFQDEFEELPGHAKTLDAVALLLMVVVVGFLIAPAIYHRQVDDGDATRRTMHAISLAMSGALALFALCLGINIFIAFERIADLPGAMVAAIAVFVLAFWFWFGAAYLAVLRAGGKELNMADQRVPLLTKIDQLLTEARVILPGVQALLGFQLAVVLTQSFERLPTHSKATHAAALGLVAMSTILLMAPAAYHRIVYAGEASQRLHELGSRLIMAATISLALGLAADVYVVIAKIAGGIVGVSAALFAMVLLIGLWHLSPIVIRSYRSGARRDRELETPAHTPH